MTPSACVFMFSQSIPSSDLVSHILTGPWQEVGALRPHQERPAGQAEAARQEGRPREGRRRQRQGQGRPRHGGMPLGEGFFGWGCLSFLATNDSL